MFEKELILYRDRAKKFSVLLARLVERKSTPFRIGYAPAKDSLSYEEALLLQYQPIALGEVWGREWETAWFHLELEIPAGFQDAELALKLNFNGEVLLYDAEGVPCYALTSSSVFNQNFKREIYHFGRTFKLGEKIELRAEAAAISLFGVNQDYEGKQEITLKHPDGSYSAAVSACALALLDRPVHELKQAVDFLLSLESGLAEKDYRKEKIVQALSDAEDLFGEEPSNAAAARRALDKILRNRAMDSAPTAHAVGHAHIDTAWLWPVKESERKCARTFATQLEHLKRFPDYVFGASAALHYQFVKDRYPRLYGRVRDAVKAGRWEPQGAMWVEADCNLVGGESLARQFLFGKNFFMDEFGFDVRNLWLPDAFGFPASLPQFIKRSGCDYFLSQKLSWSQFTPFPRSSFRWKGIDGSEVLAHFLPENTYNSLLKPATLMYAQDHFAERATQDDFMSLFGIGDGGAGPSVEHIESGLLARDMEGLPKVKFGRADRFFDLLETHRHELPAWSGELYLERHRGTLTTQARCKRGNRKNEQRLALLEFMASALPLGQYPRQAINDCWRLLLLNQFHDILPGSSIKMVYERTLQELGEIEALAQKTAAAVAEKLFQRDESSAVLVNSLSYPWTGLVELPEAGPVWVELPPLSFTTLAKTAPETEAAVPNDLVLENALVRYEFAENGELLSAYDKEEGRSILRGKGNQLSLYIDTPVNDDAWDVDVYYRKQRVGTAQGRQAEKRCGKFRSSLHFSLAIGNSTVQQTVALEARGKRLDFHNVVEWNEAHRMLRVSFETAVLADEAAFDIQYGFVKRPTHDNTLSDLAKFEAAGQRYADISESAYGVALLNDCKYGYYVKHGTLDLGLLRSPKYPDWSADLGKQEFSYALLPHCGPLVASDVMREAACFNRAPLCLPGYAVGAAAPPCRLEGDGITVEAVKKAEKGDYVIVRVVENLGARHGATLVLKEPLAEIVETNLVEWDAGPRLTPVDGRLEIKLSPFEIKTLRISSLV